MCLYRADMDAVQASLEFELLILMAVIVTGPIIAERFRIPGLVGLIAGGVLVGPFVLGWVGPRSLVAELGAIGILYLMFLAGLEFSLRTFVSNRRMAVVFGLLGFAVPFFVSLWVSTTWLGLGTIGGALVGAMWASNTLVAYPDVQAAGLQENKAVGSAVAAGVIADLISLTVLAVATSVAVLQGSEEEGLGAAEFASSPEPPVPVWVALPLLAFVTLVLVPRVAKWFFVRVGRSRVQRFVFSLAIMAGAAAFATWGGVEGLIGAFLAGLGMNRLIPKSGSLFERIEFVGSSLFVPAFLVSIGLSIDPLLLFDLDTLFLALVFTGLVVVGKLVAALLTGFVFKLSTPEVGIMATLSMGQAASTLAISQVGVSLGVFDVRISNAAVLAIVAAVFITSYGTRYFIPKVERPTFDRPPLGERILVDASDDDPGLLMQLAGAIAAGDQGVVSPFAVTAANASAEARERVDRAVAAASALGQDADGSIRYDDSLTEGALQLAAETDASLVLMSWDADSIATDVVFGSHLDTMGNRLPLPMVAAHLERPWTRVLLITGDIDSDWQQEDAAIAMSIARRAARTADVGLAMWTPSRAIADTYIRPDEVIDLTIEESSLVAFRSASKTDLVVMPSHALREAGALGPWRIVAAVKGRSVAIVGGPHRFSLALRAVRSPVHGLVSDPV